jgi:hypothetical protein
MSQQFNELGSPLSGGLLYFIEAGTTSTPQNAYQDSGLTLPLPNPVILDQAGRVPQFYLADGSIKIRLTDSAGVQQLVADNILVIGPSSGGGGGGSVDPTTIFQTGDVIWLDVDGTRSGWVRDNARTIGSSTSGASERANADTEALFNWLWQNFDNTICPVSSGRGASSAADWAANKNIATPDKRGYIPGGLDTMGNSAASRFASVPVVSGSTSTPGSIVGEVLNTLTTAQMPSHTHTGLTGVNNNGHTHTYLKPSGGVNAAGGLDVAAISSTVSETSGAESSPHTHNFTTNSSGSGTAHNNVQKTVLGTFYRKL